VGVQGKGVVVAGGASGLGLATCRLLTARGARLAIIDANGQALADVMLRIGAVAGIAGNIAAREEAFRLLDRATQALGRIGGLVNCAGVYPRRPILEITDQDWDLDWQVNVRGTYNLMAAAVTAMRKQQLDVSGVRGRIVNISSVDGFKAHPKNAHYAATKAAVISLTRSFALELRQSKSL
jgi:3-oxoacyl-[acyl-carrier protein] reductase